MHIAGKMQVNILHRQNLRIAAPGRTAFYAKHRAQRGFAQRNYRPFTYFSHGLPQAYGCCCLPFARRGGVNGGNQHQLTVGLIGNAGIQALV